MQSAYAYSGKTVTIDGEDYDVPEFSVYEEKCKCCCCRVAYFPSIKKYFCNQWEVSLLYPAIIIVLTTLAYAFGIWSVFTTTNGATMWIIFSIGTLIYVIWWIAYLQSMCRSAGYLPWYWFVEKRTRYTYEEQMGGIITNNAQSNFCNVCARPERAILSTKARRIVLRADHICQWIGNWVGLKNYRYFFTQLVWFVLLFIFFFVVIIFQIIDLVKNGWETTIPRIALIILFIPVMLFFIFFMIVFTRHIRYLVTNNTTVHELKSEKSGDYTNPYDLGCWQNCVETLGPAKYCPIWFCPCPIPRTNDGFVWKRNDQVAPNGENNADPEKPEGDPFDIKDNSEDGAIYSETVTSSDSGIKEESSTSSFVLDLSSSAPGSDGDSSDLPASLPEMEKPVTPPPSLLIETPQALENEEDHPQQGLSMAPPMPPPMFSDFGTDSGDEKVKPKNTRDGLLDALVDKTIDGEDDDEFDAYVQGTKAPPVPSIEPVVLTIKETDPEAPAKPKKIQPKRSNSKAKGSKRGTRTFDSMSDSATPKRSGGAHVHVKKIKVPIIENGKETDKYQVRKIKVVERKGNGSNASKTTKSPKVSGSKSPRGSNSKSQRASSSPRANGSKSPKTSGSKSMILAPQPVPPPINPNKANDVKLVPPKLNRTASQKQKEEIRYFIPPK